LTNSNGQKAKDVTKSSKILEIINRYEKNQANGIKEEKPIDIMAIHEEEEELSSSYT